MCALTAPTANNDRHLETRGSPTRLFVAALALALVGCGQRQSAPAAAAAGDSAAGTASAPLTPWHDPSPHTVRFVTVPSGTGPAAVRLEVLDWGGQGEALVFLAGLENTGHIFDDLAPRFADHYHVLAITRRGWGASDHPDSGYTIPVLVSDVHGVLDSLRLTRSILVGHSIAGQELTWLAAKYPDRIDRLIYLDAGFDYHAHPVPGPLPDQPPPSAADSASPVAGLAFQRRMSDAPITEGDYRATEKFSATGKDLGAASPPSFSTAVFKSAQATPPPLSRVRVPTLAIYDWPVSAAEALPWLTAADTSAPRLLGLFQAWHRVQRDEFKAMIPRAQVVELPGASHYVFLVKPDSVTELMRQFLAKPPARKP